MLRLTNLARTSRLVHQQPLLTQRTLLRAAAATQLRFTASSVSGQPASKDVPSAVKNAKEEASHVAGDLAKTIAGGQTGADDVSSITRERLGSSRGHAQGMSEDFLSVTSAIASNVPKHVMVFGLAGGLPYLGTSLSTLYLARQSGQASAGIIANITPEAAAELLDSCTHIQVTYGAVMLSFLGALHWGMEFSAYGGYKGYQRLVLGAAPLLVAWPTLAMEPTLALVAQWAAFTGLWYADMKATNAGWTPKWYSQYRFYLSILVGSCILGTLFGINYLGPTTDVAIAKNLKETGGLGSSGTLMDRNIREKNMTRGNNSRMLAADADVKTEVAGDDAPAFVKLVKRNEEDKPEGSGDDEGEDKPPVGSPDNAGAPGEHKSSAKGLIDEAKDKGLSKGPNKKLQGGGDEEEKD